jgi:hypothetical protein
VCACRQRGGRRWCWRRGCLTSQTRRSRGGAYAAVRGGAVAGGGGGTAFASANGCPPCPAAGVRPPLRAAHRQLLAVLAQATAARARSHSFHILASGFASATKMPAASECDGPRELIVWRMSQFRIVSPSVLCSTACMQCTRTPSCSESVWKLCVICGGFVESMWTFEKLRRAV